MLSCGIPGLSAPASPQSKPNSPFIWQHFTSWPQLSCPPWIISSSTNYKHYKHSSWHKCSPCCSALHRLKVLSSSFVMSLTLLPQNELSPLCSAHPHTTCRHHQFRIQPFPLMPIPSREGLFLFLDPGIPTFWNYFCAAASITVERHLILVWASLSLQSSMYHWALLYNFAHTTLLHFICHLGVSLGLCLLLLLFFSCKGTHCCFPEPLNPSSNSPVSWLPPPNFIFSSRLILIFYKLAPFQGSEYTCKGTLTDFHWSLLSIMSCLFWMGNGPRAQSTLWVMFSLAVLMVSPFCLTQKLQYPDPASSVAALTSTPVNEKTATASTVDWNRGSTLNVFHFLFSSLPGYDSQSLELISEWASSKNLSKHLSKDYLLIPTLIYNTHDTWFTSLALQSQLISILLYPFASSSQNLNMVIWKEHGLWNSTSVLTLTLPITSCVTLRE